MGDRAVPGAATATSLDIERADPQQSVQQLAFPSASRSYRGTSLPCPILRLCAATGGGQSRTSSNGAGVRYGVGVTAACFALLALLASVAAQAAPTDCYGSAPAVVLTRLETELLVASRVGTSSGAAHAAELSLAAREIAAAVAAGEPAALERQALRLALVHACAFDPAVSVLSISAAPHEIAHLLARQLSQSEFTHVGVGVVRNGRFAHGVIVGARREAELSPFPRDLDAGGAATLRGSLRALREPWIAVTDPASDTRKLPSGAAGDFSAPLSFDKRGKYVVEVVGVGARGPEIAAYLVVAVGGVPLDQPSRLAPEPEPADPLQAEARVAAAVNTLRALHGLRALEPSTRLSELARRYSGEMLDRGMVAHVLPGSSAVGERLERAGIAYQRARENLAFGETTLIAQQSLEESPAHLANFLDNGLTHLGVGTARAGPAGPVYLTEILLMPAPPPSLPAGSPEDAEARVREALRREAAKQGRRELIADPQLDAIAAEEARKMMRTGALRPIDLRSIELAGARSEQTQLLAGPSMAGQRLVVADVFATRTPEEAARSHHLADRRLRCVGVGVASGGGQFWIAVLYAD